MKSASLQLALRETHALLRKPRFALVLGSICLLMGLVGPFGTFGMPLLPRLAYWVVVVVGTAAIGTTTEIWAARTFFVRLPSLAAATLGGAVAGLPIGLSVWGFNWLVLGGGEAVISVWLLLAYCVPIAALITAFAHAMLSPKALPAPPDVLSPDLPALLQRLPRQQRGRLLHIAVSDHYVDVTTDRGTTLVLMRFSDAIREAAPEPGLQVHRSHWVALSAVRRSLRHEGKLSLELENGRLVPVSRTFVGAARAARLLA